MAWNISVHFDTTGNDFNISCLFVYQDSSYYRVYIRQNKMNCFHSDSHYTITDWW